MKALGKAIVILLIGGLFIYLIFRLAFYGKKLRPSKGHRPIALPSVTHGLTDMRTAIGHSSASVYHIGVILPSQWAVLASKVEGRVDSVKFDVSESVHQGDVLATLDVVPIMRADLAAAEANAQSAMADLQRVTAEHDHANEIAKRQSELFQQKFVSVETLSISQAQETSLRWQIVSLRAKAAEKRAAADRVAQMLRDADIRAPFDGTIAARYVRKGEMLSVGKPSFRLIGTGPSIVRFALSPNEGRGLRQGVAVEIHSDGDAQLLHGVVSRIAPDVDPASHMLIAEATLIELPQTEKITRGVKVSVRLLTGGSE